MTVSFLIRLPSDFREGIPRPRTTSDNGTSPRLAGLLLFAGGSQFAVQEFGGGAVSPDPIVPAEQVVNFVGDNQLLEGDFLRAQFFDQIGGLLERHVAIVAAMDQQYRRAPICDASRFEFIERKPLMMQAGSLSLSRYQFNFNLIPERSRGAV